MLSLIEFPYFADTSERGDVGVKAGPKTRRRHGDLHVKAYKEYVKIDENSKGIMAFMEVVA
jgi:hypothetical protein